MGRVHWLHRYFRIALMLLLILMRLNYIVSFSFIPYLTNFDKIELYHIFFLYGIICSVTKFSLTILVVGGCKEFFFFSQLWLNWTSFIFTFVSLESKCLYFLYIFSIVSYPIIFHLFCFVPLCLLYVCVWVCNRFLNKFFTNYSERKIAIRK